MEEIPSQKAEEIEVKRLVGVRFSAADKEHSFNAGDLKLFLHDLVVVEGDKGHVIGRVTTPVFEKKASEVATNIKNVIRRAVAEDVEKYEKNREEAAGVFNICWDKIIQHGLPMKLVDVDILTGDAKAVFYFTAEERVDFRALVKDLAATLHMRIEMRQIGARDAAKSIGSLASCGLICCCERFLKEFKSIAIQMAKSQGLSPNPAKLTGMCGKLKCCLYYENDMYNDYRKTLPDLGKEVETPKGKGIVSGWDIPRQLVSVKFAGSEKEVRFKLEEIGHRKPAEEDDTTHRCRKNR